MVSVTQSLRKSGITGQLKLTEYLYQRGKSVILPLFTTPTMMDRRVGFAFPDEFGSIQMDNVRNMNVVLES
jgi:hypothetical protein